jgi:hypothetical protein
MRGPISRWLAAPRALLALGIGTCITGYSAPSGRAAVPARSVHLAKPATELAAIESPAPEVPETTVHGGAHPLDALSRRELQSLVLRAPERLGCASIGKPNRGRLLNGVSLRSNTGLRVVDGAASYGTPVTVGAIEAAVAIVLEEFPESPVLAVGDISRKGGGYLRPHRSHQTGLDVDVGYYYLGAQSWYTIATSANLDRPRTWVLLKALVAGGNVEYVFMDRSVQRLLHEYAEAEGEDPELLAALFESRKRRDTLVRHRHRHLSHFHVRFHDAVAEEAGRRLLPYLTQLKRI